MAEQYVLLVRHGETSGNRERRYVGSTDEGLTAEAAQALKTAGRAKAQKLMSLCARERENSLEIPESERTTASETLRGTDRDLSDGRVLNLKLCMSPMRRCRETAAILFPDVRGSVIDDFREMDFGQFEYKNYSELNGNPAYQAYIDSGGESAFPGGESKRAFCERVVRAAEPLIFKNARDVSDSEKLQKASKDENRGGGTSDPENGLTVLVVHGGTIMAIMDRFSSPHEDYFSWRMAPGGMLLLKRNGRSLEVVER